MHPTMAFCNTKILTVFMVLGSVFGCWPTLICHIYQQCPVSGDCIQFFSVHTKTLFVRLPEVRKVKGP